MSDGRTPTAFGRERQLPQATQGRLAAYVAIDTAAFSRLRHGSQRWVCGIRGTVPRHARRLHGPIAVDMIGPPVGDPQPPSRPLPAQHRETLAAMLCSLVGVASACASGGGGPRDSFSSDARLQLQLRTTASRHRVGRRRTAIKDVA